MLCDLCKKNQATIFLEAVGKNGKKKINLCFSCAVSRGIATPIPQPEAKNLASVFAEIEERELKNDEDALRLCPICGRNLKDIKSTGIVGCPECYETFKTEITEELKKRNIFAKYTGSMPKRLASFRNVLTDRIDIQAKLNLAVKQENYEKAAVYRDFLRALERGSVADGSNKKDSDSSLASTSAGENNER